MEKKNMNNKLNKDRIKLMKSRISIERSEVRKMSDALIYLLSDMLLLAGKPKEKLILSQPYYQYFEDFCRLINNWIDIN